MDTISTPSQVLLDIVNYNFETNIRLQFSVDALTDATSFQGQQYVCAGELLALQTITNVLNFLKQEKIDVRKVKIRLFHFFSLSLT